MNYIYQGKSWIGVLDGGDLELVQSDENGNEKKCKSH